MRTRALLLLLLYCAPPAYQAPLARDSAALASSILRFILLVIAAQLCALVRVAGDIRVVGYVCMSE